ncbi:MAG: dephospho-CoA kinase [Idiomarina sp.]|nr:dephospho-CoA kinase [Idiomarina sp.]
MKQWVIGVTGGIGCGKTQVTNRFAARGIDVVDADIIARNVVEPGSTALIAIREHFGDQMIQASGELDRAALRARVFANPVDKDWLNALLHPLIREHILNALTRSSSPYVILSAPLLLENHLNKICDRVLVVDVPEATQISRTQARDQVSAEQIQAIIAAQLPREERLKGADDVIDNQGSLDDLDKEIDRLHQKYLALAGHDSL